MIPTQDNKALIEEALQTVGVITIFRRIPPEVILPLIESVVRGGIRAVEITADSSDVLSVIETVRRRYGAKVLVGAGTLMTPNQIGDAMRAGAQFLVSPHFDPRLFEIAQEHNHLLIPGVFTPSEVAAASRQGASLLKLFPAGPVGPMYLRDLQAPFGHVRFIPTGGLTPTTALDYVTVGAAAVGLGMSLVNPTLLSQRQWGAIAASVSAHVSRLTQAFKERRQGLGGS